jgi:hypothetical protein
VAAVRAFVALNFVGGIGLFVVTLTAIFSPKVRRLPTWYNFCVSWILSCISYTLLTFAGQQTTSSPSHSLCFAQSVLIYAVPPLSVSFHCFQLILMKRNPARAVPRSHWSYRYACFQGIFLESYQAAQILNNFSDTIANLPNRKIHHSPPSVCSSWSKLRSIFDAGFVQLLAGPYFIFLVVLLGVVLVCSFLIICEVHY